MLPNQTKLIMHKGKRAFSPCSKCGFPVKPGKKYIVDPENTDLIYHAVCYEQKYKLSVKNKMW